MCEDEMSPHESPQKIGKEKPVKGGLARLWD